MKKDKFRVISDLKMKYLILIMVLVVFLTGCAKQPEDTLVNMKELIEAGETNLTYTTYTVYENDDYETDTFIYDSSLQQYKGKFDYTNTEGNKLVITYTVDSSNKFDNIKAEDENGNELDSDYEITGESLEDYNSIQQLMLGEIEEGIDSYETNYENKEYSESETHFSLTLPVDDGSVYKYDVAKDATNYKFSSKGTSVFTDEIQFDQGEEEVE